MATPASFGPVPEPPVAGAPPAPPEAGPGALVGRETAPGRDVEAANRGFVQMVRTVHESLEDMARQFPAFGPFARRAQEAIKEGMVRTLATQSRPEESAPIPRIVG